MITCAHTDPSNYGALRVQPPRLIVIHGTGLPKGAIADGEVAYLRQPDLGVSYHFYIAKDGRIWELVPPGRIAYHAGVSEWSKEAATARGVPWPDPETESWLRLNPSSIGIGLESHNDGSAYPQAQIIACRWLCNGLMWRYGIPPWRVLTHKMISWPRKNDPVGFDIRAFTAGLENYVVAV